MTSGVFGPSSSSHRQRVKTEVSIDHCSINLPILDGTIPITQACLSRPTLGCDYQSWVQTLE
jgi:hypothetical protein